MDTLDAQISARASRFKGAFVPVFKADCDDRPYHAGTMTAVALPGLPTLVTARHVLDRDENNECDEENQLFLFSGGKITPFGRFQTGRLPIPGGILDLAVILTGDTATLGAFVEPIPAASVRHDRLTEGMYLAACGFPGTKNRVKGKQISNRPYGYFGKLAADHVPEEDGYDPTYHFALEIDLKRVYRAGEKKVKAPDPDGISGGPVFLVHDFKVAAAVEPMLAGIVIARTKNRKHLICIRAEYVLHIAGALQDHLLASVPILQPESAGGA